MNIYTVIWDGLVLCAVKLIPFDAITGLAIDIRELCSRSTGSILQVYDLSQNLVVLCIIGIVVNVNDEIRTVVISNVASPARGAKLEPLD